MFFIIGCPFLVFLSKSFLRLPLEIRFCFEIFLLFSLFKGLSSSDSFVFYYVLKRDSANFHCFFEVYAFELSNFSLNF